MPLDPFSIAMISFAAAGIGGALGFGCGAGARRWRDDSQWHKLNSQLSAYFADPLDFDAPRRAPNNASGLDVSHLSKADMYPPLGVEDSVLPASHGSSYTTGTSSGASWNSRISPLAG